MWKIPFIFYNGYDFSEIDAKIYHISSGLRKSVVML